jgi:hypothetical protein
MTGRVTRRITVSLPDDVAEYVHANAGGNASAFVAALIQQRRDAEMWQQSKQADAALGLTDDWMRSQVAANDAAQAEHLRQLGLIR